MKKSIVLALTMLLVVGAAGGTFAFGRGGAMVGAGAPFGGPTAAPYGPAAQGLDLTNEQIDKLTELRMEFLETVQSLKLALQKKALELRALWSKEPRDQSAIASKTGELTTLQVQLTEKAEEFRTQLEAVLTPEQREKLSSTDNFAYGHRGHGRRGRWQGPQGSFGAPFGGRTF